MIFNVVFEATHEVLPRLFQFHDLVIVVARSLLPKAYDDEGSAVIVKMVCYPWLTDPNASQTLSRRTGRARLRDVTDRHVMGPCLEFTGNLDFARIFAAADGEVLARVFGECLTTCIEEGLSNRKNFDVPRFVADILDVLSPAPRSLDLGRRDDL